LNPKGPLGGGRNEYFSEGTDLRGTKPRQRVDHIGGEIDREEETMKTRGSGEKGVPRRVKFCSAMNRGFVLQGLKKFPAMLNNYQWGEACPADQGRGGREAEKRITGEFRNVTACAGEISLRRQVLGTETFGEKGTSSEKEDRVMF